jgi:hypothetical protein
MTARSLAVPHATLMDAPLLLMAMYGSDWEALIGTREPLWRDQPKYRGFLGIGGKKPYHTRFSAAAVINGSVLFHDLSAMEWLGFDNPHARVRRARDGRRRGGRAGHGQRWHGGSLRRRCGRTAAACHAVPPSGIGARIRGRTALPGRAVAGPGSPARLRLGR